MKRHLRHTLFCLLSTCLLQAQPTLEFEVASIHVHQGPLQKLKTLTISGSRVLVEGYNIPWLLEEAFGLENYQVITKGIAHEADVRELYYDIAAKVTGDKVPTKAEVRAMLRSLLRSRFHIVTRTEPRELPVFALSADRDGARLTVADDDSPCTAHIRLRPQNPAHYDGHFEGCAAAVLVSHLNSLGLDRPVIDNTGLTGKYTFHLVYTPEFIAAKREDPGDIRVQDAVRTLGLRLEPRKSIRETLILEKFDNPGDN